MQNQNANQNANQNGNQEQKRTFTVIILKNQKKEANQEEIKMQATLVFAVPDDDHYNFLQQNESIQKNVVFVQKCQYQNEGHIYKVNDEISACSSIEKWKNQNLLFYLEDEFPFEKLIYFQQDKNYLKWVDKLLDIDIQIKLIVTDLKSDFKNRKTKEFDLETISFDKAAEEYIKGQFDDCQDYLKNIKILEYNRNLSIPSLGENLSLQFNINQIIYPNQPISLEQFKIIQSSLDIQNVFVYTCYQVTIKSKYFAQPLRIFSKNQILNWGSLTKVELKIPNVSQVPFIYDSDKVTCKHFLIINLQYKKFFQIQGIDVLIPIVIVNDQKKHNHYISKNIIDKYFEIQISNSMVTFTLNQQNSQEAIIHPTNPTNEVNIQAHFKQLLE